ncbi:hypothetical protein [Epilithonimonas sp. UC225_85]|uniref:tetratricopeptide repeat protein n=1 Tax=Epilithonimonas sp. UC225_85 TaxID=3350167 RepID=UPI0036D28823
MITVPKYFCKTIIILFFMGNVLFFYSQNPTSLKDQVNKNGVLFNENMDKAYAQINTLLKSAVDQKNYSAELILLDRKCRYFYGKEQMDDLIITAEELDKKSLAVNDNYFQGMSNIYLAEAYSVNGLYDRAIGYLDKAYTVLNSDRSGKKKIFLAKANVLNSYANVYSDKGEPKKAVQKLREIIKSYSALKNDQEIDQFQYVNYSNIASVYADYNSDSAKYFALKSISLKPSGKDDDGIMMMNYFLLGQALKKSGSTEKAIDYYHKALKVSDKIGLELNKKLVYSSLVDLYKKNGKKDSAIIFENKLKQLEISILQSKYNSLQKVVVEDQKKDKEGSLKWLYILAIIILMIIILVIYLNKKRKKKIIQISPESYLALVELAKKNDPAYLITFELTFPDFSEKLLKINPDLQKSEIEFCTLLKLDLSTKDIAKITSIETRTVQNKKYRIRKRLNIPASMDIYNWFNSIN